MKIIFKKIIVAILTLEARMVLAKYKPKIVAVTGNVGKTSTKDALYTVLAPAFKTRKSEKSFNSEIGLPLTILGLSNGWSNPFIWLKNIFKGGLSIISANAYPEWLVIEVGADRPGDILKVSSWLSPYAVVMTFFGKVPVHIEFFSGVNELIKEKTHLISGMKENGVLLLNADDPDVLACRDASRQNRVVTFSISEDSNFKASNFEIVYDSASDAQKPIGVTFKVNYIGNSVPIRLLGALGRSQVYPILAAIAFGNSIGLNTVSMIESVAKHKTPPGRMSIISGVKNSTIIDDSYNSSPAALSEALRTLRQIKTSGKKIAILGDMLELGKYSIREHEKAGQEARASCDILITVGIRARDIAMGALDSGMDEKNIFQFDTSQEASKPAEDILKEGDVLLVKGSQGIRMEKIVEEIMAEPEDKERLLVRQEKEWSKR